MSSLFLDVLAAPLIAAAVLGSPASLPAGPSGPELRVCADPNNLPFSNQREEGFENRIAQVLAHELGARVRYTWWMQRRGMIRNTLDRHECDVVMGVAQGFDRVLSTAPYYRSSYVFVTRAGGPRVRSLDDPLLRTLTIGVALVGDDGANPPPVHALASRGIVDNVRGYLVYGDDRDQAPGSAVIRAVERGEVDVGIAWGPVAGYFAGRARRALRLDAIRPSASPPTGSPVFAISIGVRRGDEGLRRLLESALARRSDDIRRILTAYGVPTVPEAP